MKPAKKKIFPEFIATVQSLSHEGRGIAILDGKITFIHGAIVSETVRCRLTKKNKRYNEAEVIEVLEPSKARIAPECAHFGLCGGCSLQHINNADQLALKQKTLLEQLQHFGQVKPAEILPIISGNPWGYRRKARLGVRYIHKKEKLLVGFREKFSNFLADIKHCPVLHQSIGAKLPELAHVIRELDQFEAIPQVEVAVSDTETALIFRHLHPLSQADQNKLTAFGQHYGFQIYLQPNAPKALEKLWPSDSNERLYYALPEHQLTLAFHPLDFTQVNSEINPLMINQALRLLDVQSTDKIIDLFCGMGNFTFPLARKAHTVVGIEGSQEMVNRALENAALNNITNVEFYAANLMESLDSASWLNSSYDKILLDPPRTGAKELLSSPTLFSAQRVVYVSCNPATLARDAGILVNTHGYTFRQVGLINMFPHTTHIEAIALFER